MKQSISFQGPMYDSWRWIIYLPPRKINKFPKLEMMHTKLFCIIFKKRKFRSNSYFFFFFLQFETSAENKQKAM